MGKHKQIFREKLKEWGFGEVFIGVTDRTLWIYADQPIPPKFVKDGLLFEAVDRGTADHFDDVAVWDRESQTSEYHLKADESLVRD